MGHRRKRTIYRVSFPEGHAHGPDPETGSEGLAVQFYGLSMDEVFELTGLIDSLRGIDPEAGADPTEAMTVAGRLLDKVAAKLHSWNLEEEDGTPIPADREHLGREEMPLVMDVTTAWVGAVTQAPADSPLAAPPSGTAPSGMPSPPMTIPMAPTPQSTTNSTGYAPY